MVERASVNWVWMGGDSAEITCFSMGLFKNLTYIMLRLGSNSVILIFPRVGQKSSQYFVLAMYKAVLRKVKI